MEEIKVPQIRSHKPLFTKVTDRGKMPVLVARNTEMHVYLQLCRDIMSELSNLESVKPLRYETRSAYDSFNQLRKKMNRLVGSEDLEKFEECIVLIADQSAGDVDWVKNMLRTQMVNKVPYNQLDAAILIGVAGGFLDVSRQLFRHLFGRDSGDLDKAYSHLKRIDKELKFSMLNEGQEIDFAECRKAMEAMFRRISQRVCAETYNAPHKSGVLNVY